MKSFFSYIHTCILQLYICNMYLGGVYKYVNVYDFNIFFSKDNIIHQTYFKIFVYEVLIASDPCIREGCKYNFGYLKVHIYCSIYLLESLLKPNFKSFPKSFWQNHDFFLPISLFSHLFFVPLHFFFPFFLFSSLFPSFTIEKQILYRSDLFFLSKWWFLKSIWKQHYYLTNICY